MIMFDYILLICVPTINDTELPLIILLAIKKLDGSKVDDLTLLILISFAIFYLLRLPTYCKLER